MRDANGSRNPVRCGPRFRMILDEPRVRQAHVCFDDLATVLVRTQDALNRMGRVLCGKSSAVQRRQGKEIAASCEWFFAGWKASGAVAEIELAELPA
jgi:hypothetical protein